ncbi:MAG: S8 family serine peptidase, partial [bacterium]
MLTRRSLIAIAAIFTLAVQSTPSQEYYRGGRLVPLAIDSNYIQIKFRAAVSDAEQQQYIDLIRRITDVLDNPLAHDSFLVCSLQTTVDFSGFLDSIRTLPVILHAEPYYMDEGGGPRLVSDRFVVSFVRGTSIHEIESINANYGVEIDHELQHMGGVYVLVNTPTSGRDIVQIANLYYELDITNFSHPCFAVRGGLDSYRLFDEYHPYQNHLKKVIGEFNQASVWDFAGLDDTITVAVLDDGIDWWWPEIHHDIDIDRILQGYDFAYDDSDVTPAAKVAHGIGCASIIAANHATDSVQALTDTTGVISLNPTALILPVRVSDDNGFILNQEEMA